MRRTTNGRIEKVGTRLLLLKDALDCCCLTLAQADGCNNVGKNIYILYIYILVVQIRYLRKKIHRHEWEGDDDENAGKPTCFGHL